MKLYTALYMAECLAHGVAQTSGCGIPPSIIQREEKNKAAAEKLRGATKAARLVHSLACPDLVAMSMYDTKPVHILSMTTECVRWDVKERLVWSTAIQKKAIMKYLRLNIIEEYNSHMNSTDVADQLQGNYRPDRWMRQRKWWWAFFIWSIGVAGVNAYRIYEVMYDEEVAKGTPGIPPRWSHARFLEELVYDFIFPNRSMNKSSDDSTNKHQFAPFLHLDRAAAGVIWMTMGGCMILHVAGRERHILRKFRQRIYRQAIEEGHFKHRLDEMRHNTIPCQKDSHCQWCYYKLMNEYDGRARRNMRGALGQNRQMIP